MAKKERRKPIKSRWVKLPDRLFRHVWRCPRCKAEACIGPDYYEENGTPVCSDCDEDGVYVRTEVDMARVGPLLRRRARQRHRYHDLTRTGR